MIEVSKQEEELCKNNILWTLACVCSQRWVGDPMQFLLLSFHLQQLTPETSTIGWGTT
jgi:hypothetical protein